MNLPLPQIYGAVWRSDITEVRRRSSGIQNVRGRTPGAWERGAATSVKELDLVDAEGDRGLVEVPVADGAARGLRPGSGARGPWAGKGPVSVDLVHTLVGTHPLNVVGSALRWRDLAGLC
jgi:hypothetical protein